jgi:two-component system nitrogen regulation response regulator NtrX
MFRPSMKGRDDIPHLVEYFLELVAAEYGQPKKNIDKDAVVALQDHDWTGNIRELRNVVERLIILSGKNITVDDVRNFVLPRK